MSVDEAFVRLRDANPVPRPAALRDTPHDATGFLLATRQRSREMQTELEQPTTPRTPTSQRPKWIPALAAFVVVILVGVSIAVFTNNSEPDAAGVEPGPITSFDDIAGTTYERQGAGEQRYFHFFEDGTWHVSSNRDLVEDRPQIIIETRFEGTKVFLNETRSGGCDEAIYEIHLLENGNLQLVPIEDKCAPRLSDFDAEWLPVP